MCHTENGSKQETKTEQKNTTKDTLVGEKATKLHAETRDPICLRG